jgi:hypothetical protein
MCEYNKGFLNKIQSAKTHNILLQIQHVILDHISTFRVVSCKQKKYWKQEQSWKQYRSVSRRLAQRFEVWIIRQDQLNGQTETQISAKNFVYPIIRFELRSPSLHLHSNRIIQAHKQSSIAVHKL